MKCPLTFRVTDDNYGNLYINGAECLQEECAWWEKGGDGCAVMLLGLRFGTVCDQLTDLLDKMPKSTQFGR